MRQRRSRSLAFVKRGACSLCVAMLLVSLTHRRVAAAEPDAGRELLRTGRYDECAQLAAAELKRGVWIEQWTELKIQAELFRGRYEQALASLEQGLARVPSSLSLRLLGRDVYRFNGRGDEVPLLMEQIERLVRLAPQRYASAEGRVALGRYFLLRGADARQVLDQIYDTAKKLRPDLPEIYFATAELALGKEDDALAAETLRSAPPEAADDPRYHFLLARAFAESDRARAAEALSAALQINPQHLDSLMLQADQLVDAERYDEAEKVLSRVLDVNPREPRAWAYRAVLAHIANDTAAESKARTTALSSWEKNPEVDHLIGRELSQKYRFTEGEASQRSALEMDPAYLPARVQLCQDLLRLGREEEGWKLAEEILETDGYNVVGYNLTTLRDEIAVYRTLSDGVFQVRMDEREAELYGVRVMTLLAEARETLSRKYEVEVTGPVLVEIFPHKKDFAVRTFGMPGADGFLGVCFGPVITVNSPASQGEDPANWEAVLWHEFCHTVTLTKTRNRMPRWLSEGISVYEEGQRDPAWATAMSPEFRAMILGEDFTPLSELSSAFLAPKSAMHLQFAYFESALAVEFLVERFGFETLTKLLDALGAGEAMNEALVAGSEMSLERLDAEFEGFARSRARAVAPDATWEKPELPPDADSSDLQTWVEEHPTSFYGRQRLAATLIAEGKLVAAEEAIEAYQALFPEYVGADNPLVLRAALNRRIPDAAAERTALIDLTARDASQGAAYLRLIELASAAGDWEAVADNARRLLAINPLIPAPHRSLAQAAERLGRPQEAIAAYRALARLDDTDPAALHYRVAKLLQQEEERDAALREVLKSLEEAPRFREAHSLLLELVPEEDGLFHHLRAPIEAVRP